MEQILRHVSSDNSTLFFRTQIKTIEVSQLLQIQGTRLSQNQIKRITNQNLNIFAMTEKLFSQNNLFHLFELIKQLCLNYNSMIVLLSQRLEKQYQRLEKVTTLKQQRRSTIEQSSFKQRQNQLVNVSYGQMKIARLGGVQLYNESYTRYIQDKRFLQQIKLEREEHTRKRKRQILNSMVIQQLNNIEEQNKRDQQTKDEIEKFILEGRKKNSLFNYTSYQPQLRNIMDFFQNIQSQAKQFLAKRGRNDRKQTQMHFSFSDFQRDVNLSKLEYKNQIFEKVKAFMSKVRQRQKQLQQEIQEKEAYYKKLQNKQKDKNQIGVQTQLVFRDLMSQFEKQKRQLYFKCTALQSLKDRQEVHLFKQVNLQYQLNLKQKEFQRIDKQKKQLELGIVTLKKFIKEEKSKKVIPLMSKSELQIDAQKQQPTYLIPTSKKNFTNIPIQRKPSNISQFKSMTEVDSLQRDQTSKGHSKIKYPKFFATTNGYQRKVGLIRGASVECAMQTLEGQVVDIIDDRQSNDSFQPQLKISMGIKAQSRQGENSSRKNKDDQQHSKDDLKKKKNSFNKNDKKDNLTIKAIRDKSSTNSHNTLKHFQIKSEILSMQKNKNSQRKYIKSIADKQNAVEELKINSSKKNLYKMFDVEQQRDEEVQSFNNYPQKSERSCKKIEKIRKNFDFNINLREESILNENKREDIKYFFLNRLYSMTIYPQKRNTQFQNKFQQATLSNIQQTKFNNKMVETSFSKKAIIQNNEINRDGKNQNKIVELLQSIPKVGKNHPQIKIIKQWKQNMIEKHKQNLLNQDQIQQIVKILVSSSQKHQKDYSQSVYLTPKKDFGKKINRKSLPGMNPNDLIKYSKTNKMQRSSLYQENIGSPWRTKYQEKQIKQLIRQSSLDKNFAFKFIQIHRQCRQQGPICSHIKQYFETVMRQIQQIKIKQRQSVNLHIENIGVIQSQNSIYEKSNNLQNKKQLTKQFSESKQYLSMNKQKQYSLQKVRNSKICLPLISNSKRNSVHKQ